MISIRKLPLISWVSRYELTGMPPTWHWPPACASRSRRIIFRCAQNESHYRVSKFLKDAAIDPVG